jgi:hypothetical protein
MADENEGTAVRYPECEVELLGVDKNAVAIFRKVRKELIRYLADVEGLPLAEATAKGDEFQTEATSGDYDHVQITCHRWVTVV